MAVADSVAGKIRADAPRHGVKMICDVPLWRWRFLHTQPFPIPLCEMMVLLFMLRMSGASECGAMGDVIEDGYTPIALCGHRCRLWAGRPVPSRRVQRANRPRGPGPGRGPAAERRAPCAEERERRVGPSLSLPLPSHRPHVTVLWGRLRTRLSRPAGCRNVRPIPGAIPGPAHSSSPSAMGHLPS